MKPARMAPRATPVARAAAGCLAFARAPLPDGRRCCTAIGCNKTAQALVRIRRNTSARGGRRNGGERRCGQETQEPRAQNEDDALHPNKRKFRAGGKYQAGTSGAAVRAAWPPPGTWSRGCRGLQTACRSRGSKRAAARQGARGACRPLQKTMGRRRRCGIRIVPACRSLLIPRIGRCDGVTPSRGGRGSGTRRRTPRRARWRGRATAAAVSG
jgi:hypothetical protein